MHFIILYLLVGRVVRCYVGVDSIQSPCRKGRTLDTRMDVLRAAAGSRAPAVLNREFLATLDYACVEIVCASAPALLFSYSTAPKMSCSRQRIGIMLSSERPLTLAASALLSSFISLVQRCCSGCWTVFQQENVPTLIRS